MNPRRLGAADLDAITALDKLCFPPGVAFSRGMFEDCVFSPECDKNGIEKDGALVAFSVVFYPGPRSAQIITIDVHPDHRRQGLADELMKRIEADATNKGVVRMTLQVAVDNEPAKALYEKWGYKTRASLNNYYGRGRHAFLMDKTMTGR